MATLVAGLGGDAGYGEITAPRNDDGYFFIDDISAVFETGLNFFGTVYTGFYVNTNGSISFGSGISQYTPSTITGGAMPMIAPFWADVDTRTPADRGLESAPVYVDIDGVADVITVTWPGVNYFAQHGDLQNYFQLQIKDTGAGNFDITFRYQDIQWTTGDASDGTGGLGGVPARAGYTSGAGQYIELPQSGDQGQLVALENTLGNTGEAGIWNFSVVHGAFTPTVSLTGSESIIEGGNATFTLARAGDLSASLTVTVSISSLGFDPPSDPAGTYDVTFAAGAGTATLVLPTADDLNVQISPREILASIASVATPGYQILPGQGVIAVMDNDNQLPTGVSLLDAVSLIPESLDTSAPVKIADIAVIDDGHGTNVISLEGADASLFEVSGTELFLKAGTVLDFETKPSLSLTVVAADSLALPGQQVTVGHTLQIGDVNEAPTAVTINAVVSEIPSSLTSSTDILVATLGVVDPDTVPGDNAFGLGGADANSFYIDGDALYLKASTLAEVSGRSSFDVTVTVDDASVGGSPDAFSNFSLAIIPTNSPPFAADDAVFTNEKAVSATGNLLSNDSDPDSDALTVTAINGIHASVGSEIVLASGAKLTVLSDGTFTYKPNSAFNSLNTNETGSDSFTYTVDDGHGHQSVATANVSIAGLTDVDVTTDFAALLAPGSGITITSAVYSGASTAYTAVAGVDLGTVNGESLSLGSSIFLTSGNATISLSNTSPGFTGDNGLPGYAPLDAILSAAGFPSSSLDAAVLSITFTVSDPNVSSISFDAIFGSEEFPIYINNFVDIAAVFVDGQNYAYFNTADPTTPLSVLSQNVAAGYFLNNDTATNAGVEPTPLAIEYNGVSHKLSITGALDTGLSEHTLVIAIADTKDHVLDSGIFVSNVRVGTAAAGINAGPQARDDAIFSDAAAPVVTFDALANDNDPNHDALTITAINGQNIAAGNTVTTASGTKVTLNADQSLTYDQNGVYNPAPGQSALETVTYTISDGHGGAATGSVEVTVAGPNSVKILSPDGVNWSQTDTYNSLAAVNSVSMVSNTEFLAFFSLGGISGAWRVTGNPIQDANGNITGGTYTKAVLTIDAVDIAEFVYTKPISIAALNQGVAEYVSYGNSQALDDLFQRPAFFTGNSGADGLHGTANADSFSGGAGNDFLSGGAGTDTAFYGGNSGDYEVSYDAVLDHYTVKDLRVNTPDGTDTLVGIENLSFGDGTFAPASFINHAPTAVALANTTASIAENISTAGHIKVADIVVTDDALGTNVLGLTGTDASAFEIVGNALYLKAGTALDFEAKSSYSVAVTVNDASVGATPDATSATYTLAVTDVNEAPTAIALANTTASIAENTSTAGHIKVADMAVTDDALGTNVLGLAGADASAFEIVGNALYLKAGTALDFEAKSSYSVAVTVNDASVGATPDATSATYTLAVTDANEAPTAVDLTLSIDSIDENTDIAMHIKVADIAVTDDGLGSNTLGLTGADAALFELIGNELFLKAGTALDFETQSSFDVSVTVNDASVGSTPDATSDPLALVVGDVNEGPTDIALSAANVNEFSSNGAVVGTLSATDADDSDTFTFALTDNAGGRFTIVNNELRVANRLLLDYEQSASHTVTVEATDSGGLTFEKTLTISVRDVSPENLTGDSSNNTFFGGALADTLKGGGGSDTLRGFAGDDILKGDSGNDVLVGGLGRDTMTGGSGADRFDFDAVNETGRSAATRDIITDFKHDNVLSLSDRIDLSTIDANSALAGNQAFVWKGTAAFSGGKGQLHYTKINLAGTANDKTIVEGDINGDKVADFQIELTGLKTLKAEDFIL